MSLGLFDVLGPVMHGPSSSHTGGANRIGYLAGRLMGGVPEQVSFGFHPAYMGSYRGQQSHVALLAGCLGLREYEPESRRAVELAAQQGMLWGAKPIEDTQRSRNTMDVHSFVAGQPHSVKGESVGGGNIRISEVDGLPAVLTGNEYVLLLEGEKALVNRAIAEVKEADDSGLQQAMDGPNPRGEHLGILVFSKEPPAGVIRQEKGLSCRQVEPIFPFRDRGEEPLCKTFEELLTLAQDTEISELAISYEAERSGVSRERVLKEGRFLVKVMKTALEEAEREGTETIGGLTDPEDGRRLLAWSKTGEGPVNGLFTLALARAMLLGERNAGACRVVACPTGGAAGALPGALITAAERYDRDEEALARAFLVAALTGVLIGNQASFSGTVGGCQSEIGIGAAMGAAGVAYLAGGGPEAIAHAAALTLKNLLGLTCDPPASPVEVPCIKRNAMGAAMAFFGADLALGGIRSAITPDDVVLALADTQARMPMELKFSHKGGLAITPSGRALKARWEERLKKL